MSWQLPDDITWGDIALFLHREKERLDPKHHEFIDDMVKYTSVAWPSLMQRRYLHNLFQKLGGKIT
jgi:hypothetical protein